MIEKHKIMFPAPWEFRLIYQKDAELKENIEQIFADFRIDLKLTAGIISSNGTYRTWRINAVMGSQVQLNEISMRLRSLPGVKFLL